MFHVLLRFHGSFPRFKVKFNYETLLNLDFLTYKTNPLLLRRLKIDKITTAKATEMNVYLLRRAHSRGQNHALFC